MFFLPSGLKLVRYFSLSDEATGGEKKLKAAPSSSAQNYSDFFGEEASMSG